MYRRAFLHSPGYPEPELQWYLILDEGGWLPINNDDKHTVNILLNHANILSKWLKWNLDFFPVYLVPYQATFPHMAYVNGNFPIVWEMVYFSLMFIFKMGNFSKPPG